MPSLLNLTVVDCGGLLDPDNGIVQLSGTVFGSQANYSCVNGYKLVGVTTRTCLETQHWSDTAPSCQSMHIMGLIQYIVMFLSLYVF